eukprot:752322-Hanusia_phi.AAC.1
MSNHLSRQMSNHLSRQMSKTRPSRTLPPTQASARLRWRQGRRANLMATLSHLRILLRVWRINLPRGILVMRS